MKQPAGGQLEPKATGNGGLKVAESLLTLANVHRDHGKAALSEALYQQALGLMERAVGQGHPALAKALEDYAALLRRTRRQAQAEEMEHRAEAIRAGQGVVASVGSGR